MPTIFKNEVTFNGFQYKVKPGTYNVQDVQYFAEQRRQAPPSFTNYVPEIGTYFPSLHNGYGSLYKEQTDPTVNANMYYTANGVDASVMQQNTLAPAFLPTGVASTATASNAFTENFAQPPIEFNGVLFAAGSQNVYNWNPAASPNGWQFSLVAASAAGPIGQMAVFSTASNSIISPQKSLYVPTGSQFWFASTASTWTRVASHSAHFSALGNLLAMAYYDTNNVWQISFSSDGITFGAANETFIGGNGVATINGLLDYDGRLFFLSTQGVQTIDGNGTIIDMMPEVGQYGDPAFGKGSNTWHGLAYIPSAIGLLQFSGSNVVNPQIAQAMLSMGPDVSSWSQSDVRGTFRGVAPHVNYLYATLNSNAGNGHVLKFRDYPSILPGQGWHPIKTFTSLAVGAAKVSALNWYTGTSYPILWTSAGSPGAAFYAYQARLPANNDNALLDSTVLYQTSGTIDLPICDDDLPTVPKIWERFILDVTLPPNTTLQMQAAYNTGGSAASSGSFVNIGGVVSGTTGIVEVDFAAGTAATQMQPRLVLTASNASGISPIAATTTPVIRDLVVMHLLRPTRRRYWTFDIVAEDNAIPNAQVSAAQQIANLDSARQLLAPLVFQDAIGQAAIVSFESFSYTETDRKPGVGTELVAHLALQELGQTGYYTMSALTQISLTS